MYKERSCFENDFFLSDVDYFNRAEGIQQYHSIWVYFVIFLLYEVVEPNDWALGLYCVSAAVGLIKNRNFLVISFPTPLDCQFETQF